MTQKQPLADNPKYNLHLEIPGAKFYVPVVDTDYHITRVVEMNKHAIYANAGATVEVIREIAEELIKRANNVELTSLRTDVAALAGNLLYRTKYPIDEHATIRMGAAMCFMETGTASEDPDRVEHFWLMKKEKLAFENPKVYDFFLLMGAAYMDAYNKQWSSSANSDYFAKRMEAIKSLMAPISISTEK